jgi:hypothetical protein
VRLGCFRKASHWNQTPKVIAARVAKAVVARPDKGAPATATVVIILVIDVSLSVGEMRALTP